MKNETCVYLVQVLVKHSADVHIRAHAVGSFHIFAGADKMFDRQDPKRYFHLGGTFTREHRSSSRDNTRITWYV